MNLIEKFKYLPNDITQIIVNYTDIIVFRNGKYIDRINKNDKRYKLINKINRPISIGPYKVIIKMMDNSKGYIIEYDFRNNLKKAAVKFIYKDWDGYDSYYSVKTYINCIFNANNIWSKTINYCM